MKCILPHAAPSIHLSTTTSIIAGATFGTLISDYAPNPQSSFPNKTPKQRNPSQIPSLAASSFFAMPKVLGNTLLSEVKKPFIFGY